MVIQKDKLIKSPLNYVGGKYKLLPQILPLFPGNIETFYDVFAGGGNVGININAKQVIFNDTEEVVIDLMRDLSTIGSEEALEALKKLALVLQKFAV